MMKRNLPVITVLAVLEEIVRCSVCLLITHSKILQCPNGHLTCAGCSMRISSCPMCRAFLNPDVEKRTRALAVEQIIEAMNLDFRCRNGDCRFSGPKKDLMEHQNACEHHQQHEELRNTGYGMFIQATFYFLFFCIKYSRNYLVRRTPFQRFLMYQPILCNNRLISASKRPFGSLRRLLINRFYVPSGYVPSSSFCITTNIL